MDGGGGDVHTQACSRFRTTDMSDSVSTTPALQAQDTTIYIYIYICSILTGPASSRASFARDSHESVVLKETGPPEHQRWAHNEALGSFDMLAAYERWLGWWRRT